MPTIEQIRQWLEGQEQAPGLPDRSSAFPNSDGGTKNEAPKQSERNLRKIEEPPPSDDMRIYFGKYKDTKMSIIAERDPQYLVWCLSQDFPPRFHRACEYFLGKRKSTLKGLERKTRPKKKRLPRGVKMADIASDKPRDDTLDDGDDENFILF